MRLSVSLLSSFLLLSLLSCSKKSTPLGSVDNPVKFYFLPSVDAKMLEDGTKVIKAYLEKNTPYKYDIKIPTSYIVVVEAFGTNRADVASINTFGYILANEKYGAQAKLCVMRFGDATYQAQIVARTDSGINKLEDVNGKKFAFVDPASTSGYMLPAKVFKDRNIKPSETVFANRHDNVITMVYQKQVDAGATFYTPPRDGKLEDARRLVLTQFPDVEKKVKIVELTDSIPNDPVVFRKDMPEEMKNAITKAMLDFVATEEGKKVLHALYGVTGYKEVTDSHYDAVRSILKALGKSANEFVK